MSAAQLAGRLTAEQVERYRAELHKLFNHHYGVDALCDMALRSLDAALTALREQGEPVAWRCHRAGMPTKEPCEGCDCLQGMPATREAVPPEVAAQSGSVEHRVIKAAYRPGPMCRDCADTKVDGLCDRDGTKCDPFEAALDRLRGPTVEEALLEIAAEYDKTPGREAFTTTIAEELRERAKRPFAAGERK